MSSGHCNCSLKGPLILATDFLLLLGSEVILDVELLADFLRGLALDHVGDGEAGEVQKWLDVEIVCGENELEQGALIDFAKLAVKYFEFLFAASGLAVLLRHVALAIFDDFG